MKKRNGLTIEVFDNAGNVVQRIDDSTEPPKPIVATKYIPASWARAVLNGVTFHQQPCGSFVATSGPRRVCGFPPERNGFWTFEEQNERAKDLIAGLMLTWLAWDRGGRR